MRDLRATLTEVRAAAVYLSPFVWRATLSDAVERAMGDGYMLGRDTERREERVVDDMFRSSTGTSI